MTTGDWPKSRLAILALLIVAPLVTLWPLFGAEFTNWDDPDTVVNYPDMSAPVGEAIAKFWSDWRKPQGDLYIPLTRTAWRLMAEISRRDETGRDDFPGDIDLARPRRLRHVADCGDAVARY